MNPGGGVKLSLVQAGNSSLNVPFSYEIVVKDLNHWATAAFIPDACGDWDVTWREWLITGIERSDGSAH